MADKAITHTTEPWHTNGSVIIAREDVERVICMMGGCLGEGMDHATAYAHAARIVLCVNACTGRSNEELQKHITENLEPIWRERLHKVLLERQRQPEDKK